MGQYRSVVLKLILALLLLASPAAIRAQDAPTKVQVYNARNLVDAEVARLNALAATIRSHPFHPPYYDPPCSPTKDDALAELGPYRRQIRAERAEVQRLKNEIGELEKNVDNQLQLDSHGWDPHSAGRFSALDRAMANLNGAMDATDARLDAIKPLKCPRPSQSQPQTPATPQPYNPGADEITLGGDAMPLPGPVTFPQLALPDHFCSPAERSRFYWNGYEPWSKGLADQVVAAFNYAATLEARYRRLRGQLPDGDPRVAAALRTYESAQARAKDLAAQVQRLRDDTYKRLYAVPMVACGDDGKPMTTPGPTPPPGYFDTPHRPVLINDLKLPALPDHFCKPDGRYRYLMDVYFPLADKANANARAANEYMWEIADRQTRVAHDSAEFKAPEAEYRAYDPIRRAANAFADALAGKIRPAIDKIPEIDCAQPTERPMTTPQPPTQPPGASDGPRTGQLPPGLVRPQLQRVPELSPPASFCSEEERVRYLNEVYNPAAAIASTNAQYAHDYRVHLNELFNEYMRKPGGAAAWAAIQDEMKAWAPIDDAARAKADAMGQLYKAIMAIPVVPCAEKPKPQTAGGGGHAGGPALPTPPRMRDAPEAALPERFCTQAEFDAYMDRLYAAARIAADNADKAAKYMAELHALKDQAKAAGDKAAEAAIDEALAAFQPVRERAAGQAWAMGFVERRARMMPIGCPPPTQTGVTGGGVVGGGAKEGPMSVPPRRPNLKSVGLAIPPRFCTAADKEAFIARANDVLDEIEDNLDALEGYEDALDELERKARADGTWNDRLRAWMENEDDWGDTNYRALDDMGAMVWRLLMAAKAAPVGCPDDHRTATGGGTAIPGAPPPTDGGKKKDPCPPEHKPIDVGPNGKVGSGARAKQKAASTAMGVVGGLLGGGGGGGGGGGSTGPQLWTCRIKDKEMTVFDDPATGISLAVGAKEGKGGTTVFAKIDKSPDSGTFQTAFLENADGARQAPKDVGICGLWGEWQLTVSWTKTTYVDGQVVSREEGGWSKSGTFGIPGVLSPAGKADGLWRRLGFSNASHGAREIAMVYPLKPEDFANGPVDIVIHVTRPGEKEVTTAPFVLRMTRTADGFTFTREANPCEEGTGLKVGDAGAAIARCGAGR